MLRKATASKHCKSFSIRVNLYKAQTKGTRSQEIFANTHNPTLAAGI